MCEEYPTGFWGDDVWWSGPSCKYAGEFGRPGAEMDQTEMILDEREITSLTQCIDAGGARFEDPNGKNVYREYFYEDVVPRYPIYNQMGFFPTAGCTVPACDPWGRAFELSGLYGINNETLTRVKRAGNYTYYYIILLLLPSYYCPIIGNYVFNWTDDEAWDVPLQWDDVEIHCNWTVTLDQTSKVMATLTIRGTLRFLQGAQEPLALHAHIINILGGKLIIGEDKYGNRMPFDGPMATIMLHGDVYNWGKECPSCGKKIFVSGELVVNGKPRQVVRRMARDAYPGDDEIVLAGEPVDWVIGDQIVLTAVTNERNPVNVYPNDGGREYKFIGKPAGHISVACEKQNGNCEQMLRQKRVASGTHEIVLVSHASADGHTVYLQNRLEHFHSGTMVDESIGVVMDTRDTVALLTRNAEIRGGNSGLLDELRGDVKREEMMYGFTIHGEAGGTLGGSWEAPGPNTRDPNLYWVYPRKYRAYKNTDRIFGARQPPFKFPCGSKEWHQTESPVDVIEAEFPVFATMPVKPLGSSFGGGLACECWPGGPQECCGCKLPPARISMNYVTLREGGKQWTMTMKNNQGRDLNMAQYPTFIANADQSGQAGVAGSTLKLTGIVSGAPHTGKFSQGYKRVHLTEGVFFGNAPSFDEDTKTPFADSFEKVMLVQSAKKMKNHRESRPWDSVVGCPRCAPVPPPICNYTYLNHTDWMELMPCDIQETPAKCHCLVRSLKDWHGRYHPVHRTIMQTYFEPEVQDPPNVMLINNLFLPGREATFGVFHLNASEQKRLSTVSKYFAGRGYQQVHESIFDNYTTIDQGCRYTCSKSNPLMFKGRGTMKAVGNRVIGAYVGWTIRRPCEGIEWRDNVAMGNWMGAQIQAENHPINLARAMLTTGTGNTSTTVQSTIAYSSSVEVVTAVVPGLRPGRTQTATAERPASAAIDGMHGEGIVRGIGHSQICAMTDKSTDISSYGYGWLTIDLGEERSFSNVRIMGEHGREQTVRVRGGNAQPASVPPPPPYDGMPVIKPDTICKASVLLGNGWTEILCEQAITGRYVTVDNHVDDVPVDLSPNGLTICEFEVLEFPSCATLRLEAYRNVIGVGATPLVREVSNAVVVENSVGLMNHLDDMPPEFWVGRAWRWANGVTDWVNCDVIGRSEKTRRMQNSCAQTWGGEGIDLGGFRSGFRPINTQWDFVGIQVSSGGTRQNPIMDGPEIDGVRFVGFGPDACGRTNVAITNEPAGWGRGSHLHYSRGGGRVDSDPADSNFGFAVCAPLFVRNLDFHEVPADYRYRFSHGKAVSFGPYGDGICTADPETGETRSSCEPIPASPASTDYGFSECQLFDEDGSLAMVGPTCSGDVDHVPFAATRCDGSIQAIAPQPASCTGSDDGTSAESRCDPPQLPTCAIQCDDICSLTECFDTCIQQDSNCDADDLNVLALRDAVAQLFPWANETECTASGGLYVSAEAHVPCQMNTANPPHCLVFGGNCQFIPAVSEVVGVTCELNSAGDSCSAESDAQCTFVPEVLPVYCDLNEDGTGCSSSSNSSCVYRDPQSFADADANPYGITAWLSGKQRMWPPQFLDFCKWTLDKPDWYDVGDGANRINDCPVWLREHKSMLELVEVPEQQGVQHNLTILQSFTDSCAAAEFTGTGASDCPAGCVYAAASPASCTGTDDGAAAPATCTMPNCADNSTVCPSLPAGFSQTDCEDAGGNYAAAEAPVPCALHWRGNKCRVSAPGGNCVFTPSTPESCTSPCLLADLGDEGESASACPAGCTYTPFQLNNTHPDQSTAESCVPAAEDALELLRNVGCTYSGNAPLAGGLTCKNHDFLYLNITLAKTMKSGSELLYGPVGLSSCNAGEKVMNVIDTEYFPHNIKGGSGPNPLKIASNGDPEHSGGFWTVDGEGMDPSEFFWGGCNLQGASEQEFCVMHPTLFYIANGGCYNFETTGTVTEFKKMIVQLKPWAPKLRTGRLHKPSYLPNWGVVLAIPNLNNVQVNVFKNGIYVAPVGRRMQVTTTAQIGTNYFHPMTRTLHVTVGVEKITIQMLEVASIDMDMTDDFDDFFGDNDL
eukprot:SAG31_NODE_24_length_33075_cov_3.218523_3_plen_2052_part_01